MAHKHSTIGWAMMLALSLGLWAGCTLTGGSEDPSATPIPSPQPFQTGGAPLVAAWVDNGDLFTWTDDNPMARRIASGGVIRAMLAPDGAHVVYLRGPGGDPRSLWISDTPGAAERQLVDAAALPAEDSARRIDQVVWSGDGQALYFTTFAGMGMDTRPADDLWRVAASGGSVERLLDDGQGGRLALSPDGAFLALASAGHYVQPGESGGIPAQIALLPLAGGERRVVLDYSAVATASQGRWYPDLHWLPDSSGLRTAIPPADLVYGAGETALWALPVQGDAIQLGLVDADFFGLPVFSDDGNWIAFMERRATPEQADLTLHLARSDGSAAQVYSQGAVGAITRPVWLPGTLLFTFNQGAVGAWWLGGPGLDPRRFPSVDWTINELAWIDSNTALFSAAGGDSGEASSFGLYIAPREGDAPVQAIAATSAYPFFDAVRP